MVVNLSDKFCPLPNSAAKRVGCRWDRSQLRFWTGFPEMTELDVGWVPMADPVFGPSRWGAYNRIDAPFSHSDSLCRPLPNPCHQSL
jgi:hypothetical protein